MAYTKTYFRKKKGNKYQAKGRNYNGMWFDSTFELNCYQDLEWKLKAGELKKIERQVKLDLTVNGVHITNYYIDFKVTHADDSIEYIEAKGFETPDWRIKWALFHALKDEMDPGAELTLLKMSKSKFYRKI